MPPVRTDSRPPTTDFLHAAFQPGDTVAIFLKSYVNGRITQRLACLEWVTSEPVQAWLRAMNARRFNVYVSVNTYQSGSHRRTRACVADIRHVFLEADADGDQVLTRIEQRPDLPGPGYVLHSSPNRVHVFWRATGFTPETLEPLQKQLAAELGTDPAATPVTQNTRLPGFFNHKHAKPYKVWVEYRDTETVFSPADFPCPPQPKPLPHRSSRNSGAGTLGRAVHYLSHVPPAISGQHGDVRTFQVCCRLVRGFALSDDEAMAALAPWNARCEPPWAEPELRDKLRRARQYGREPVGGLL